MTIKEFSDKNGKSWKEINSAKEQRIIKRLLLMRF